VKEDLETKFKNSDDPLRIVFVCAMWITGFDVPSCSTIYLDKPMKNHTLMQTIARANRVWGDKQNGLIVDYVGVFRNLQKALAIYGTALGEAKPEVSPVHKKEELVSQLQEAISGTTDFCIERNVNPATIQEARGFERVKLVEDAVAALVVNDDTRRGYLSRAGYVDSLFKSLLPDVAANEFGPICKVFRVVADTIRKEVPPVDISEVMAAIEALLNQSIGAGDYELPPIADQSRYVDLSQIDFEKLREKFEGSRKPIEVQKLRAKLTFKLARMIQVNRTRIDFLEEFQKMIDEYNNGAINVQVFFDKLLVFARRLDTEEKRGLAEQLTEEELVIFDLLTKPDVVLTSQETAEVKKVAKSLLEKLKKEKLVLDWRKQQTTRAMVFTTIQDILDELPRVYSPELYKQKCDVVYQHFYEAYMGQGKSVYGVN
jgi:type I restriction enzyme R subunit